jgi:CRP-like cAMP-binding protein
MSDDLRVAPTVALGVRERLLAVRSLGILEGLDDDGALLLAEYSKLTSFEAGEEVTSASTDAESVHIVLEGRLLVPRPNGTAVAIDDGRGVGVIGVLANTGKGLRSFADQPTRTLEISKDAFLSALEESFSIARNVLKVFAAMLLDARGALPGITELVPRTELVADRREPRTLVERVMEVSRTGIFVNANIDPIFDVARAMRQLKLPEGHVLFRKGEAARSSIQVLSGQIRCTAPDGQFVDVSAGYMLGGLSALAGRTHDFDARALTEVVAYEIQFEDFLVILESHPELTTNLLENLARDLLMAG